MEKKIINRDADRWDGGGLTERNYYPRTPKPEGNWIECHCQCHTNREIKHVIACCNNGWIKQESLDMKFEPDLEVQNWQKSLTEERYERAAKIRNAIPQLRAMGTRGAMIADFVINQYLELQPSPVSLDTHTAEEILKKYKSNEDNLCLAGKYTLEDSAIIAAMTEYSSLRENKAIDTHTAEDIDASSILIPYILSAPRSVGKGGNFEEYILCRDFEEIIENIKRYASLRENKSIEKALQVFKDNIPHGIKWQYVYEHIEEKLKKPSL